MPTKSFILKARIGRAAFSNILSIHTIIMKVLHTIAFILVIVGGLNWGLVGLGWLAGGGADWNVVHMILGSSMESEAVVYVLVGLSAIWLVVKHKQDCKVCAAGGMM